MSGGEVAREAQLAQAGRSAAVELLKVSAELRWGDGTPAGCAASFLHEASAGTGIAWLQFAGVTDLPVSARAIFDRDDWTCQHCGTHCNLTVDHIVPRSKGGTDDPSNLQTLCGSCNSRKGAT